MKSLLQKISDNEFYRGGAVLTVSSFAVNFLNYIFNVFVGRSVGPTGFGEIATLLSYTAIVSLPLSIISTIVVQKISAAEEDRYNITKSFENFFWIKIRRWWFLLAISLIFIPFVHRLTNLNEFSSYLLVPLMLLGVFSSFYQAAVQGLRLFTAISIIGVVATILKMLGPIVGIFFPYTLQIIILFLLVSLLFSYIAQKIIVQKEISSHRIKVIVIEKRIITLLTKRQFWITTLSVFAVTLFTNVDFVFVKKFLTGYEVGIYSAWMLLAKIVLYVVGPITSLSFIYFSSANNRAQQNKTLVISLFCLILLGIIMVTSYNLFGNFIITMLLGSKFLTVVPFLGLAGIFGTLYTAILLFNNYFLAKNSIYTILLPLGMLTYIVILFFIPRGISSFFYLNIIFGSIITGLYGAAYVYTEFKSS